MDVKDPLSRAFAALADPTRRAILERLAAGEAGVVELADASTLTQPAITKHLKVLERAGLVGRARDGQRRPARLPLCGLLPVDDWLARAPHHLKSVGAPNASPRPAAEVDLRVGGTYRLAMEWPSSVPADAQFSHY